MGEEDDEDDEYPCCEADMLPPNTDEVDKYAEMAERYERALANGYSGESMDPSEEDLDEDVIGKSLPPCAGSRKAVRIAHGGVIPHENRRQYSDRGRTQIFFRTSRHS